MLVISMLVMGLGGYALLGTLFSSSWQRETRNAAEENRMLAYSFVAYWNTTVQEWQNFTDEEIQKTAEAMSQGMTDSGLTFRIYDGDGQPLYMEKQIPYDQEKEKDIQKLIKAASGETRARELREENGTYELATMSSIQLGEKRTLYLESDRDVTALFNDRTEQYRIYRRWMLVVLLLELPVCYLMTVWLLKPLSRLVPGRQTDCGRRHGGAGPGGIRGRGGKTDPGFQPDGRPSGAAVYGASGYGQTAGGFYRKLCP